MRSVDASLGHEAHAPIALRLRRALYNILPLDQLDIGSRATCQFEPDHEFRNVHAMLDEPPARASLLVRLVEQPAPHIVAVLAQQPRARPGEAVDQRERSFVEHALLGLAEQALDVSVLP